MFEDPAEDIDPACLPPIPKIIILDFSLVSGFAPVKTLARRRIIIHFFLARSFNTGQWHGWISGRRKSKTKQAGCFNFESLTRAANLWKLHRYLATYSPCAGITIVNSFSPAFRFQ